MMTRLMIQAALVALALMVLIKHAKAYEATQPINVVAQKAQVPLALKEKGRYLSRLEGNVHFKQGMSEIHAQKVEITHSDQAMIRIQAFGEADKPLIFETEADKTLSDKSNLIETGDPMYFESDQLDYDLIKSEVLLEGNVHFKQGMSEIHAQKVEITHSDQAMIRIQAFGEADKPLIFETEADKTLSDKSNLIETGDPMYFESDQLDYDLIKSEVLLEGNVHFKQKDRFLKAETVWVNLKTHALSFESSQDKPVTLYIDQPSKEKE